MTKPSARTARAARPWGGSLLVGARWTCALMAALALAGIVTISPSGAASAASSTDNYNQMTGIGTTASAVTVKWTQGLLDSNNQPITTTGSELSPNSDRSQATPSGPLSFMYPDFKSLQVTVSQTQNIGHQGVTVTWKGGVPSVVSASTPQTNFLQMMECYGDSSAGPSPEDCEYGSQGMLAPGAINPGIGDRAGTLCTGTDPVSHLPTGPGGPEFGCDPHEPTSENPSHCDPNAPTGVTCKDADTYVPFVPVDDPAHPIYQQTNLPQAFSEFNSDEVQAATTALDGTGQQQFETLTNVQAPHLGCGQLESDGKPRNCWLVIVPRGQFEPNGFHVTGVTDFHAFQMTSPLDASNWAQRIQIHLDFAPLANSCPLNVLPTQVVGTQVIARAMSSWQFALNQAAKCNRVFIYTASTENESTQQLTGGGAGLAFTTIPIGSEVARTPGGHVPSLPTILYAPVAVTALGFGFNVNEGSYLTTPVKLTPRLLARGLTQVYRFDLPDVVAHDPTFPGPKWALTNPGNITQDPAFKKLNPEVTPYSLASIPLAPLVTVDRSALNQQVWQWIQSDPATNSWLDGTDKSDPVAADPDYVKLKLGKAPAIDSFPHAYSGVLDKGVFCANPSCTQKKEEELITADMLPFADDMDSASASVLGGIDKALSNNWNPTAQAPDNTFGWWDKVGVLPLGQVFMWAASDMPDLAAYGLIAAQFCAPSGAKCVGPTIDSVTNALASATADNKGLLHVNPAKVPAGGYPLVDIVYAAVPTNQSAAALTDYADLIQYAVGHGQTTGSNPGDLPPGYLPLSSSLQAKAMAVVRQLRAIAHPPTHSPSPTPTHTVTATQSATSTQTTTPTGTSTATPGPTAGASATATSTLGGTGGSTGSPSPSGPVIISPSAQLVGGTTPRQSPGSIRWALVVVLIIGAAGALGGGLLRSRRIPRWDSRRRA